MASINGRELEPGQLYRHPTTGSLVVVVWDPVARHYRFVWIDKDEFNMRIGPVIEEGSSLTGHKYITTLDRKFGAEVMAHTTEILGGSR